MDNAVRKNIFIAHTPLQNFIAHVIVKQYFPKGDENYLFSSVASSETASFSTYFRMESNGFFARMSSLYQAKVLISKALRKGGCQLFIPHTGALLDNYFFYSFPNEKLGNRINFYYEGVLFFYEYKEPYKRSKHLYRKVFGSISGIPYYRNPIIFPANDSRIYAIYTILPEYTLGPGAKMRKVDIQQFRYKGNKEKALILGGKPSLLTDQEVIKLYGTMLAAINEKHPTADILFKGHHADQSDNFELAKGTLDEVQNITQDSPVEQIIRNIKPGFVLSYPSSALINLKVMFGSEIEINCYYIRKKKTDIDQLLPIFDSIGIGIRLI